MSGVCLRFYFTKTHNIVSDDLLLSKIVSNVHGMKRKLKIVRRIVFAVRYYLEIL